MKKIISIIIAIISIITITACNRELTGNKTADDALNAINKIVAANNDKKGFHKALQHWGLALSGNDKFEWSKDTSANAADFAMVINAEPLINAGLDTSKLSSDWLVNEAKEENGVQIPVQIIHPYNISDKKESELLRKSLDEKKQFIDEIVEYDKMKTEFFANISHELRTPLNVILGSVQLIEMYAGSNTYSNSQAKVVRNIAIMRQNCYRLLRLVNNLIDITKIDACAFEIHLKNRNIVSIVEEITLSVSEYVENKGISLVFDTDIEEKIIACDDEKIERIILNLLSNAVKFTPEGGSIHVNVYGRGNSLCIKVSDNGIGIPEDKQREIFQRFCQISNILSRQHEESGIGLNLVKSLVEMHGGTISVESEFGKGTVFTMNLPIRAISEEESGSKPLAKQDYVGKIHIEFSDVYSVC
jgi:signal transduction histidine kinase